MNKTKNITQKLPNHSHHQIGGFPTELKAKNACAKYGKKWLTERKKQLKCACKEITL